MICMLIWVQNSCLNFCIGCITYFSHQLINFNHKWPVYNVGQMKGNEKRKITYAACILKILIACWNSMFMEVPVAQHGCDFVLQVFSLISELFLFCYVVLNFLEGLFPRQILFQAMAVFLHHLHHIQQMTWEMDLHLHMFPKLHSNHPLQMTHYHMLQCQEARRKEMWMLTDGETLRKITIMLSILEKVCIFW